ncbi:hypothetical protein D3C72_1403050 [compost metagenome]
MLDQAGVQYVLAQRAVVDAQHMHVLAGQHPGPAARCRAEVGRAHARANQRFAFFRGKQGQQCLVQLQCRARGCVGQQLQARNAQCPGGTVVRVGHADESVGAIDEHHVQARQACVGFVAEFAGLAQRRAQGIAERTRQSGQRFASVRIRMLHPQITKARRIGQHFQHRGDAVGRVQLRQLGQHHQLLAGEDQLAPRQSRCKRCGFVAHEEHVAIIALGTGVTGKAGGTCAELQFAGQLGLEALPAQAQQADAGLSNGRHRFPHRHAARCAPHRGSDPAPLRCRAC